MNKIIPVAIAVIYKDNKFLLTERKGKDPDDPPGGGRVWHFPGGAVEFGENVESALKREIREELNLSISIQAQLPVHSAVRPYWHGILISHLCQIVGPEDILLDKESFQYGWFTRTEIEKLHTLPFVAEMLEDAQALLNRA